MIEDLLQQDAQAWRRDLDAGARPQTATRRVDWRPLAAVAAVLVVVAGVLLVRTRHDAVDTAAAPRALTGTRWVDPASGGELVFEGRTVRVSDVCLNATFELHASGDLLTVDEPIGPVSVCSGPLPGAPLAVFGRVIAGPVRWSRTGDTLRLNKGSDSIVLRAAPLVTLTGTTWRLDSLPALGHPASVPDDITLVIGTDGSVRAKDICGTVTGRATITATTVEFRTRTDCVDPGFSPTTREIDTVLDQKATYTIYGTTLTLVANDHALVYGRD